MAPQLTPDDGPAAESPGLSLAEDHELRQLTWFAKAGHLSERSLSRLCELHEKDRRVEVRSPRPDPSNPHDEEPASRLPPLGLDRVATITCPNCGSLLRDPDGRVDRDGRPGT